MQSGLLTPHLTTNPRFDRRVRRRGTFDHLANLRAEIQRSCGATSRKKALPGTARNTPKPCFWSLTYSPPYLHSKTPLLPSFSRLSALSLRRTVAHRANPRRKAQLRANLYPARRDLAGGILSHPVDHGVLQAGFLLSRHSHEHTVTGPTTAL